MNSPKVKNTENVMLNLVQQANKINDLREPETSSG